MICLICCSSSYSSNLVQDQQLSSCNHYQAPPNYDTLPYPYPAYFGTIEEESALFSSQLSTMMPAAAVGPTSHAIFDDEVVDSPQHSTSVVNVDDFGAKGDGTDHDTKAFEMAWKEACASAPSVLLVPANKNYLLKPITFSGPCKSSITVMIHGTIEAPSRRSAWNGLNRRHWIVFQNIENLRVQGGGTIYGNGQKWWENSCKINKKLPCKDAPTALTFSSCNNLRLRNLKVRDSQQMHVSIEKCTNVQVSNLMITAPETSPNTDGIHIANTQNIQVINSIIRTGDDCISIESGSRNVKAMDITCGPGHGISVGSLGDEKSEAHVSEVTVDGANLFGTSNGVRIKTWQGGSGSASSIKFENIYMQNVTRPIIIDQNYCDSKDPCPHKQGSAVQVSDVVYKNIRGTSATDEAVIFDCSQSHPCRGIVLEAINLVGVGGRKTTSSCKNVRGSAIGRLHPPSCL
ncbi:Polygalacturonase 1 [Asimina triloba]